MVKALKALKLKRPAFRINFYGFLSIVALLSGVTGAVLARMHTDTAQLQASHQAARAKPQEIKTESKKIDAAWQTMGANNLLGYSSAEQECLKKDGNREVSACLPNVIYGKLQVTGTEAPLVVADKLVELLNASGWQQGNYSLRVDGKSVGRQEVNELPANFQSVHLYFFSPQSGEDQRCTSFIYASKDAQTPGWSGYIGKCSS